MWTAGAQLWSSLLKVTARTMLSDVSAVTAPPVYRVFSVSLEMGLEGMQCLADRLEDSYSWKSRGLGGLKCLKRHRG